ncbi:hypothetical protein [Methylorubrum extorquens]|uniref:hypothetical protein n=1 Tax=Methylorubrum extorquens TaxID=408 RepID=UPI00209D1DAC|nr:hypothetical protein [Methylorubrum extorquens]MCP1540043.1 hypothetical protein [Methylorubrum extorquens]
MFLLKFPLITHFLLAALYTALLGLGLYPLFELNGTLVGAVIVSAFFYGREAGQREHDLKRRGWNPFLAWLGTALFFAWSGSNRWQWITPTIASVLVYLAAWWFLYRPFGKSVLTYLA